MTKEDKIVIHIDKKKYEIKGTQITGAELRELPEPDISAEYDLFEVVPGGEDREVKDSDAINVKDGSHFFSAPRNITPGR